MPHYTYHCDFETGDRAGAGGFQVISLEDEEGTDQTHFIDVGKHYFEEDELREDIAKATGLAVDQITVDQA